MIVLAQSRFTPVRPVPASILSPACPFWTSASICYGGTVYTCSCVGAFLIFSPEYLCHKSVFHWFLVFVFVFIDPCLWTLQYSESYILDQHCVRHLECDRHVFPLFVTWLKISSTLELLVDFSHWSPYLDLYSCKYNYKINADYIGLYRYHYYNPSLPVDLYPILPLTYELE